MAFGVNKKRNPIIMISDVHGNITEGKKCKNCKKDKPLEDFNFANKEKGTRKNICRECMKNKYKGII